MGVDLPIVHMDPTDLHPYERNPRDNDGAVRRMLEAILEYGFVVPVIATADGRVIDGHLRLKAALRGKLTSIPVAIVGDLTEAQAQALRLSINRMGELADWNPEEWRGARSDSDALIDAIAILTGGQI